MRNLELALYCEGPTDQLFLSIIIQRTSRKILEQYGQRSINIPRVERIEINKTGLRQDECVWQAACKATKYHILIVHCDADRSTGERAFSERFQPGYERVQQTAGKVCKNLLAIIPIRMTEAWMLADHEAWRDVVETDLRIQELGLPRRARQVESIGDPKQTLKQVLQRIYSDKARRHRQTDIVVLYEPLANAIRLERLNEVPAYYKFREDLIRALSNLKFIIQ